MTKTEFLELCKNNDISSDLIHFENSVADGYYILQNYHRWEVFFRERGNDSECMGFPSESDAFIYLADKLVAQRGT